MLIEHWNMGFNFASNSD